MPRGRPVLSRGTKQRKKEFDSKLSAYSLTALNTVIEIAEKVEGRFVDSITFLEHDQIILEYTELLQDSVR